MMVATFKLRDLIPDTKDLLKWFWSLVWRIVTGTILTRLFDKKQTRDYVRAGWRYHQLWKAPFGLYVQSRRCWFVVVPTLVKEMDGWSWTTSMLWHRWTKVDLYRKPPEPPCESLRVLEQDLIEWVIAQNFYRDKDIPHRVGVLLHGPPGSGKTQFVKRIWNLLEQMDGWFFGNELYKIQSTKSLNGDPNLVYPTFWAVAVWEDFDRYYHGDVGVKEDMPQFADVLRMLDERLGITFITVNDITKLDPAVAEVRPDGSISRPGRIDYVVYVGVADERGRRACATNLLAEWPELIDPTVAEGEGETIAQFQNRCKKLAVARYWEGRNEVVTKQPVVEVEPRISGETTYGAIPFGFGEKDHT